MRLGGVSYIWRKMPHKITEALKIVSKDKISFSEIQYSQTSLQRPPWGKRSFAGLSGEVAIVRRLKYEQISRLGRKHVADVERWPLCLLEKVRLYSKSSLSTDMTLALYLKLITSFCLSFLFSFFSVFVFCTFLTCFWVIRFFFFPVLSPHSWKSPRLKLQKWGHWAQLANF